MSSADIETALHLIGRLGLRLEDLTTAHAGTKALPTFREYLQRLRVSVPASTLEVYGSYWRIIEMHWGERTLDEPDALEIEQLVNEHRTRAAVRCNSRGGYAAALNFISAFRCLYRHAEQDRLIHPYDNPASHVAKPAQRPSARHALSREQVLELAHVASTTGNDCELDSLLVRLHIETACRRSGALNLRVNGLDADDCLVQLVEKGGTSRWQPVSPTLMSHLQSHIQRRGGIATTDHVLRYRRGRAMGPRRYDTLTARLRQHLSWAASLGVTPHWIRHTTLTFVERECGYAVARAFAGHTTASNWMGATHTYVRATIHEVAEAVELLTGEPHPLASGRHADVLPIECDFNGRK
ncbi:tyrosine-type recombinase/integrase [Nocardia transvalensis]|uniref:tyrosine-type recombinase/integrase n=1 Tax=Nocardia transvalensis TaxID=37333 RepID=UPI0018963549|nr:site-specific integrase [Nocardia transvalensis]MBF6331452.1 site-specific integrase [Nocardia transvalensis]